MRVQSITWMDPGRTRDTLSVSGLVLQVIRRLLLLHQFTRTLSETTESGFTEWWYQPTPIETRFLVPTRSACMLRMWLDHLLPHHLLNSSFLLLPLKRYWDSTPTILRANHPFYSNPSHQPSPPMPPGTRLFFGSQTPEIIQVFISSDIVSRGRVHLHLWIGIFSSKVQNSAQIFFVVLTSLMIPSPFGHE